MSAPDPSLLSLNTVTVKRQWNLAQAIDGCARHGIRGISAWRDQVAEMGIKNAVSSIRKHGLTVTGLCRAISPATAANSGKSLRENGSTNTSMVPHSALTSNPEVASKRRSSRWPVRAASTAAS